MLGFSSAASAGVIPGIGSVHIPDSSIAKAGDEGIKARTNIRVFTPADSGGNQFAVAREGVTAKTAAGLPPVAGYLYETPAAMACVYKLTSTLVTGCNPNSTTATATGGSKAIAIVDAYDYPMALADLQAFSRQFNLPVPTSATFVTTYGSGSKPATDPSQGWEIEEALDIEWAHSMAPNAKIILVEAKSSSLTDLQAAIKVAITQVQVAGGGEVSMSWGSGEFSGETSYDSWFMGANVVFVASAGDAPGTSWPSVSPNVVSAGGTSTMRNPGTGAFISHAAWEVTGGGVSAYEPLPSYQGSVSSVKSLGGGHRVVPDVSFNADPDTGVWVAYNGFWYIVGGTSVSSPALAGIINSAGGFRASTAAELTQLYSGLGNTVKFTDVTQGVCGPYVGYTAGTGYDLCTGIGVASGKTGF